MTDSTSTNQPSTVSTWIGIGLTYGMFAIAGLMGLLVFTAGLRLIVTGEQHWGVGLLVAAMGVIFASIGIGFFYFQFIKAPAMRARRRALEARYPGQPWMLRRDWAARRVTDSAIGGVIFMWIWVADWWGAILFIWTMNRDKILAAAQTSSWEAAVGLLFPLAGLAGLLVAVSMTRTWLRYGRSVLRIDTLPGRLGDTFRGTLVSQFRSSSDLDASRERTSEFKGTPASFTYSCDSDREIRSVAADKANFSIITRAANFTTRPSRLEAEIACEHQSWVTRRRNGKTERERVSERVWSKTHALETSRMMLGGGAAAKLAIAVPLPGDQPPWALDENDEGIVWRLTVREASDGTGGQAGGDGCDAGPLFSATFEVPVFGR